MAGPQSPRSVGPLQLSHSSVSTLVNGTLWPFPTQPKARLQGQTLQGLSSPTMEKLPRAPCPTGGLTFPSEPDNHSPTPRPCPLLCTPKSQMEICPTPLLPCGAILNLSLACHSNPSARSQAIMFPVQNLRTHLLAQHPSCHRWHHFTYNIPLIRPSLGTKEHLVPHITLTVRLDFFKKLCLSNSCFSIFVSCSCLLPISPHGSKLCLLF